MSTTTKSTAEARLDAALAAAAVEDPRPALRAQLKQLRIRDDAAFERAVRTYEDEVVPALAAGAAALDTWLAYARSVGELLSAGRFVAVDASGRAVPYEPPYQPGDLVLHLPDEPSAPSVPAAMPERRTIHQQATIELLVHGALGS